MNVGSLIVVTNCHWSLLSPLTERFSRATKMSPPLTVPPPSLPVATSILLLPLPLLPAILSYPPLTRLPLSQNWGRLDKVSPKTFHSLRRIVFECNLPLLEIVASNDDGEWNMLRECAPIRAINFGGGAKKKKKENKSRLAGSLHPCASRESINRVVWAESNFREIPSPRRRRLTGS